MYNLNVLKMLGVGIRRDGKRLTTPTESEEERMATPRQPIIIEDRRILNITVEIHLYMLHDYFGQR